MQLTAPPRRFTGARDTAGMAATSFVLGLIGLLVLNVVLGPIAVVLAARSLARGTTRRTLASAGLCLGVADLVLFTVLVATDSSPLVSAM